MLLVDAIKRIWHQKPIHKIESFNLCLNLIIFLELLVTFFQFSFDILRFLEKLNIDTCEYADFGVPCYSCKSLRKNTLLFFFLLFHPFIIFSSKIVRIISSVMKNNRKTNTYDRCSMWGNVRSDLGFFFSFFFLIWKHTFASGCH